MAGIPRHPGITRLPRFYGAAAYVVELSNGVVKIGHSTTPRTRLEVLTDYVRRHLDAEITRVHVCIPQARTARMVEWNCLDRIRPIAQRVEKYREYFTGIAFEEVVRIADEESETERHRQMLLQSRPAVAVQADEVSA